MNMKGIPQAVLEFYQLIVASFFWKGEISRATAN
jgi:hypothetical protein